MSESYKPRLNSRFDCLRSAPDGDCRDGRRNDRYSMSYGSKQTNRTNTENSPNLGLFSLGTNSLSDYIEIPGQVATYVPPGSRDRNRRNKSRFEFLEKIAVSSKRSDLNVKKFPQLPTVKKLLKSRELLDYTALKDTERAADKPVPKEKDSFDNLPSGWVKLTRRDHPMYDSADRHADPVADGHTDLQYRCGIECYNTLRAIQRMRDEDIRVFGAESKYYTAGDITDLSYLSDSDVEYYDYESDSSTKSNDEDDY
jgi:hypothetical protein